MNSDNTTNQVSSFLKFLPSLYQKSDLLGEGPFINDFLKIFEKILSTIDDDVTLTHDGERCKGLTETLDVLSDLFKPSTSRADFLDWFASWMGLVLTEGWSEEKKRKIIEQIIPLYRIRGTLKGLSEFVNIYAGTYVEFREITGSFPVGLSRVGIDTVIGERMKQYYFLVDAHITATQPSEIRRKKKNIETVLNIEKPVHTSFYLFYTIPTMQVGVRKGSVVGENTLIGGTGSATSFI